MGISKAASLIWSGFFCLWAGVFLWGGKDSSEKGGNEGQGKAGEELRSREGGNTRDLDAEKGRLGRQVTRSVIFGGWSGRPALNER